MRAHRLLYLLLPLSLGLFACASHFPPAYLSPPAASPATAAALQSSFIFLPAHPPGAQVYAAFRRTFSLPSAPSAPSYLHLFADARYILLLNGRYVLRGPGRFNPKRPEFDTVDVAPYLAAGANTLAVLVHSYGSAAINGRIMYHPPGLTLLADAAGVATDGRWRCSNATEYQPSPAAWSSIPDVIDGRVPGAGLAWAAPGFDDSGWALAAPLDGAAFGALQPRALPLPAEAPIPPAALSVMPAGAPLALPLALQPGAPLVLNLGAMRNAYASLALTSAAAGAALHLEFALRFRNGAPAETYGVGTSYTTRGGGAREALLTGDTWIAHYLTLTSTAPVVITEFNLTDRRYPFSTEGAFSSSDALLTTLWARAVYTIATVTDDAYGSDARERNEWLQDPAQPNFITTRVAFSGPGGALADARPLRNLLRHAALSQLPDGRILSTFPTDRGPEDCHYAIEDYSMQWVEALRMYHGSTGDAAFVAEVWPTLRAQMAYFLARLTPRGLLFAREYTSFDDPLAYVHAEGTALNAFFFKALGDAAALAAVVGDGAAGAGFAAAAARLGAAMDAALWNASAGAYNAGFLGLNATTPGGALLGPTVHANLMALDRGVAAAAPGGGGGGGSRAAGAFAWFLSNFGNAGDTHCCTNPDAEAMVAARAGVNFTVVYYWVFQQLYAGDTRELDTAVLATMREKWGNMVESGGDAGTVWESFADSESCHNYGAVPAFFLSSFVLGVRLAGAGAWEARLVVEPRLGDLQHAEGNVVTELGVVQVSYAVGGGALAFSLALPAGARLATLRLPDANGGSLVLNGAATPTAAEGRWSVVNLTAPGSYTGIIQLLSRVAESSGGGACANVTLFPDDNFDGTNLPSQPVSTTTTSAAECAALCCATPGCKFFTLNAGWDMPPGADCYLKSAITHRANPGCVSGAVNAPSPPPPPPPSPSPAPLPPYLDAVKDCGADPTGAIDATAALRACIARAYGHSLPRVPVLLPAGVYTVSDTLAFKQDNPGPDDGINVCPSRFAPHVFIGAPIAAGGARPVLRLAAASPGFSAAARTPPPARGGAPPPYKPVVALFSDAGEGVDMNQLFKGVDLDLTAPGNPAACGVSHPGAQGATVADVAVRAAPGAFACFCGLNGAGGMHANVRCEGARYGLYIDDSQPVPSGVGVTLVNQSISAILFNAQETLSLVGASIQLPAAASGPAIAQVGDSGMSLVDVAITCGGGGAQTAVATSRSLFMRGVFISGCGTAVAQGGAAAVPGPPPGQPWLHFAAFARGVDRSPYDVATVVYAPARAPHGSVHVSDSAAPPPDLVAQHVWEEAAFPDWGAPGVLDARRDCGAVGDGAADDTAALQACLARGAGRVFLPPGLFRISDTLEVPPGGSLVGMNNAASVLLAASGGFPRASAAAPLPMLRTSSGAATIAFLGVFTWQHLAHVFTLDWRSQDPASLWRTAFEGRACECLWLSNYQQRSPPIAPCAPPVNFTIAKSVFRGLGRVYSFVNDDTGAIISTGARYRSLLVDGSAGTPAARLKFYSLNLEHAQSEANGEIRNSSFVDVFSVKAEGNSVILWLRGDTRNVSVLGFGGDPTAFAFNFTYPPDFEQLAPSLLRVDPGARGATLAALLDHGSGAEPPYWPPKGGGCAWGHFYPYPGEAVPLYPFWTFPNVTMWNCACGAPARAPPAQSALPSASA